MCLLLVLYEQKLGKKCFFCDLEVLQHASVKFISNLNERYNFCKIIHYHYRVMKAQYEKTIVTSNTVHY